MLIRKDKTHSLNVQVSDTDKKVFNAFMKEELNFYNSLVNYYNFFLKTNPRELAELKQSIINIVYSLIKDGGSESTLSIKTKDYLIGNEKYIEELQSKYKTLLNIVTSKAVIHNEVKANMFKEISNHYKNQAQNIQVDSKQDITYKFPVQLLQQQTIESKRHLQINRKLVKTTYDSVTRECRIKIPYSRGEIVVYGTDLRRLNWNIMVLHQEKNKTVTLNNNWKLECLLVNGDYLVNFVDNFKAFKSGTKSTAPRDAAVTF